MKIHPAEYVSAAQEIINYTEEILQKEEFEGLTVGMIRNHIMNNDDHPEAFRMMMNDTYLDLLKKEE